MPDSPVPLARTHIHRGPNGAVHTHAHNHGDVEHLHASLVPFDRWTWEPPAPLFEVEAEMVVELDRRTRAIRQDWA